MSTSSRFERVALLVRVAMDVALVGMTLSMAARGVPGATRRLPVFLVMGVVTLAVLWSRLRRSRRGPDDNPAARQA